MGWLWEGEGFGVTVGGLGSRVMFSCGPGLGGWGSGFHLAVDQDLGRQAERSQREGSELELELGRGGGDGRWGGGLVESRGLWC